MGGASSGVLLGCPMPLGKPALFPGQIKDGRLQSSLTNVRWPDVPRPWLDVTPLVDYWTSAASDPAHQRIE